LAAVAKENTIRLSAEPWKGERLAKSFIGLPWRRRRSCRAARGVCLSQRKLH